MIPRLQRIEFQELTLAVNRKESETIAVDDRVGDHSIEFRGIIVVRGRNGRHERTRGLILINRSLDYDVSKFGSMSILIDVFDFDEEKRVGVQGLRFTRITGTDGHVVQLAGKETILQPELANNLEKAPNKRIERGDPEIKLGTGLI